MQTNLNYKNTLSLFAITCLLFLSGCVVITTQDVRPSVTEKALIRTKCLNYVYGCGVGAEGDPNRCTNETVNPKRATVESVRNKSDLEACMTHYHRSLRSRLWNKGDYSSPRIEKKLAETKPGNEKSPLWIP
jgi:hypothetical protein